MNVLAFAPQHNSKGHKDSTGAFQPEAMAFKALHGGGEVKLVDNTTTKAQMRDHVLTAIRYQGPNVLALFCHGWSSGVQFGFGLAYVSSLAAALAPACTSVRVALYCCSTGSGPGVGGDNGFADLLRDALCRAGAPFCQVDAHATAGHATRNPHVRRFDGMGSNVGGAGGYYIVAPGSALWGKWKRALQGDLRFRFPTMDVGAIHAELEAMP